MTISVALIANSDNKILAQTNQPGTENLLTAAETIIARIPPNSSKLSYVYEDVLFHYVREDEMTYLAVSDSQAGRRLPFAFLSQVQNSFLSTYEPSVLQSSSSYDFSSFSTTLNQLLHQFNEESESDPVKMAKNELDGVKNIMTQNVDMILNRGERIELLMDRTDQVANQSVAFRRRAVGLRRQMWWKNMKIMGMAAVCLIVFLVVLAGFFGGGGK